MWFSLSVCAACQVKVKISKDNYNYKKLELNKYFLSKWCHKYIKLSKLYQH